MQNKKFNNSVDGMLSRLEIGRKNLADYGKSNGKTIPQLRTNNNDSLVFRYFEKVSARNEHFCKISNLEDSNIELPTLKIEQIICC